MLELYRFSTKPAIDHVRGRKGDVAMFCISPLKLKTICLSLFAVAIFLPTAALAADTGWVLEYYTYGGFSDVVQAFNQCALIFSSGEYKALLPSVWMVSLIFSLVGAGLYKLQTAVREEGVSMNRPEGFYSAIFNSFFGVILFLGTVVPTGTLQIYDPGENQNQAVGGVPVVSMAAAGMFNLVERSLVGLVETSGSPVAYSKQSGVKGIMVLNKLATGIDQADSYLNASMLQFIPGCVYPELTRPSSTLSINELSYTTTNWFNSFAKAVNPALFVPVYSAANPGGVAMSCTDAWTDLQQRIVTADFNNSLNNACTSAGYSPTDPATGSPYYNGTPVATGNPVANTSCIASLDGLISSIGNTAVFPDLKTFEQAIYMSSMLRRVLTTDNPDLYSGFETFNQSTSYADSFIHNLPIIRGAIIMALVVLTPFVSLMLLTKYWTKALSFIAAGFAFVTLWGSGAALSHSIFLDQSFASWTQSLSSGTALMPMNMFSSAINDRLAVYKYIAGCIMTISGGLSAATFGVLSSISSAGFASTAGMADRGRLGFEAEQRKRMATMEGRAEATGAMASGYALSQALHNVGAPAYLNARAAMQSGAMSGEVAMHDMLGHGGLTGAVSSATIGKTADGAATGAAYLGPGVQNGIASQAYAKEAGLRTSAIDMATTGGNAQTKAEWDSAAMSATRGVFKTPENFQQFQSASIGKSAGQINGEISAYSAAVDAGYKGDWQSFNALQSEVASNKSFAASERFARIAADNGMTVNTLSGVTTAAVVSSEAARALELARGKDGVVSANTAASTAGTIATVGAQTDKGVSAGKIDAAGPGGVEKMAHDIEYHNNLSASARADMKEKMAGVFNGQIDRDALMSQYGREAGSAKMVLDANSAATLNSQLKGANFKSGDEVAFGMGADGSIKFANASRGGYALDRNGHTTQALSNSITDSTKQKLSGTQVRHIDENTRVKLEKNYSEVDKTFTNQPEVDRVNQSLAASGSGVRVQLGDSVMMRVGLTAQANRTTAAAGLVSSHGPQGPVQTVSSFSIKRGGDREYKDYTSEVTGSQSQTFDNYTDRKMGVNVTGAGSALIREVAGQRGTEIIMGTTNATVATVKNAGTVLRPTMGGRGGGNASPVSTTPGGGSPSMPGYKRF